MSESPGIDRLSELEPEYEIISELGRGGSSVVYLARERDLDRDVAIKVVRSNQLDDAEAVARLAREAKLVATLRHPNIVPLLSTRHLSDGSLALVMQHIPGHTLKSAIREAGALPIAVVEHVLHEIGAALDYAHRRHSVVHRDIKPENIYLDEECGRALLSDFGIARPGESESNLTLAGTALGTPAYMSPEQIDGIPLDGRSDLFSLGLVAYEMLTGQQPWAGCNLYTIIYKQKHEELPPLTSFRNDIPAQLQRTIAGLLHKDRTKRWTDAAQFLAQLPAVSSTPDLTLTKRETALEEPVSEETPTLRYRRDEVAEDGAEVRQDLPPARPIAAERPSAAELPIAAAINALLAEEARPRAAEREIPRRRAAPGRSYAVPDAPPAPVFMDASEPAPLPVPVPQGAVSPSRRNRVAARAITFAHVTKPRSRLVIATTAFLVLGATATVVATMNRAKAPELREPAGDRGGVAIPAAAGMLAAAPATPIDTVRDKPEVSESKTPTEPERVQEKAAEPPVERNAPEKKSEKSEKPPKPKSEENAKPAVLEAPPRTLAKSVQATVTPTLEAADTTTARDESPREVKLLGVVPPRQTDPTVEKPPEKVEAAPVFTPFTARPELRNRAEVQRALSRNYPRRLREAGVGGTVMVWALIDESGKVVKSQLKDPSGIDVLDKAALKVANAMRFTPALNRDQKVRVWIELPLVFKAE